MNNLFLISTHAPRTGSDNSADGVFLQHSPFQPTLPARGATFWISLYCRP